MKRHGNILISVMLSLMVVYLGVGIVVMRCCHTGTMVVVKADSCCGDDCHHAKKACMSLEVKKLPPTVYAQHDPVPQPLQLFTLLRPSFSHERVLLGSWTRNAGRWVYGHRWSPPRHYLSLIRVLII